MAVTLDIDVPLASAVTVRLSPLAEFAAALHAVLFPAHHPRSAPWRERFAAAAPAGAPTLRRWEPLLDAFKARYFSPLGCGDAADIHDEIEAIAGLRLEDFIAMTAQALVSRNSYYLSPGAVETSWDRDDFLKRTVRSSEPHAALARALLDAPASLQRDLVSDLHSLAAGAFAAEWDATSPALERHRARMAMMHSKDPWALFEELTDASVDRELGILRFAKLYNARLALSSGGAIIVPGFHVAPHSPIKHYPGYPVVVTAVAALDKGSVGEVMPAVLGRLSALNDPVRLQICRSLLRTPASTTELAQSHFMNVAQMSRHLRRLREAGLITGTRQGAEVRYRLEVATLRRLGTDVIGALLL